MTIDQEIKNNVYLNNHLLKNYEITMLNCFESKYSEKDIYKIMSNLYMRWKQNKIDFEDISIYMQRALNCYAEIVELKVNLSLTTKNI